MICIPHAGAGASFFTPWQQQVPPAIALLPAHPPGREDRIEDAPCEDIATLVRDLVANVLAGLPDRPGPVAVLGHSFGAVLAFEMARTLRGMPGITVERLFVSGSPPPGEKRALRATGLSEDEFLDRVEELAGYRHPAFDFPELREMLLPDLIADVGMHEAYVPLSPEPLDVPITAFRGTDDALVPPAAAGSWRTATTREFELVDLPGGHMYMVDEPTLLLGAIAERLSEEDAGATSYTRVVQL